MEIIDIGLPKTISQLEFPIVIDERGVIQFKIHSNPHRIDASYTFILYEYNSFGEPIQRLKTSGSYRKGYTIGFDMTSDYYTKPDKRYALILTIYDVNNTKISEVVFIEARNRKIQQKERRRTKPRRVHKGSERRSSRRRS